MRAPIDVAVPAEADLLLGLLDGTPAAIDFKDCDGRFLRISSAYARQLGLRDPADAIGQTAADLLSPGGAQSARADELAVMRTGQPIVDVERREVHADGRVSWSVISRQPLRDARGAIVGTMGQARDITQRRLADDALQGANAELTCAIESQREEMASALDLDTLMSVALLAATLTSDSAQSAALARFEASFHGTPIGIATIAVDGTIAACNPAFLSLLAYTGEALGVLTLGGDLLHAENAAEAAEIAALLSGELERCRSECRLRRGDGTRVWADTSVALVRDTGGKPSFAFALVQDVSARRRASDGRDRVELELRRAQKLESVGQLAAGIAHEINTPIQFVGDTISFLRDAFADLMQLNEAQARLSVAAEGAVDADLLRKVHEAEEIADLDYLRERVPAALERGIGGIHRVSTLVSEMRAFAQPPGADKAPTDLNAALRAALAGITDDYPEVSEVETDFGSLPAVTCDAAEIDQVLHNLVINAAHAIGDADGPGKISVLTRADGDHVVLTIADTGCGIREDVAERVFDPFFTTKEVGRGTGQGLAIAWSIVTERHGGDLTFDSVVGLGTAFHVRLPIG
jgi:PAS domain S-box-containing protein